MRFVLLIVLVTAPLLAQERRVDPTWLRRYVPDLRDGTDKMASQSCHYKPIFGEGDKDGGVMQSVVRFAEVTVDANGNCQPVLRDREEDLYFIVDGSASLQFGDKAEPMRMNDFTYLSPGVKHSIANPTERPLRVVVMGFKIPAQTLIANPPDHPRIVNLDAIKEGTVSGHPSSVLYKLMIGLRGAKRDAIDDAYVVTSLFLMDFAPGGTNFPHHHEAAEEIYLVLDGEGDMVAGSGMDGVEGRFPAKPGDAYYFRPNCTVGFYNQNREGSKAHILAVRSRVRLPAETD